MRLKADLLLVLVAVLWGSAFAVMRLAAGHGTIFLLNGSRFLLGGLLLVPFTKLKGSFTRTNIVYVILAGSILYIAVIFQQSGLATTTAGNAGFITSLYAVFVPIGLWIIWKVRPSPLTGLAILLAVSGGFLLSTGGGFQIRIGDLLILVSSFLWAGHVIVVGRGQGKIEALPFAMGQFLLCGVLNLVTGLFVEHPSLVDVRYVIPAILYTGVFSVAIGFTLQIIAQRNTSPSDTALILCLESVFAAFFGWLFLHEVMLPIQVIGCAMILAAVVFVQVVNGKKRRI
jgi:drug/metabolite transporter (DMT)-like permease